MTTDTPNTQPSFEPVGEIDGWKLYKNSDGFIEAYKTIGPKSSELSYPHADSLRMVTNMKDVETFIVALATKNSGPIDKDYLEMLMNKIKHMKSAGTTYYANKTMETNKRAFDKTRKELNDFYTLLIKRGYDPGRYDGPVATQSKLL